jgi:PglZ domain
MTAGIVTDHLVSLIAKQVEDHALVVWYDPEGHYRQVAARLTLERATVARYEDSFFALRHQIDPLLNDLEAPRLVVYVPMAQTLCHGALAELEASGVVMQPGRQPPIRNTRLSVVARNALKSILGDESAGGIEKDVEAGKLTLAELDTLAEKGKGLKNVLSLIFGTGNPSDVALALLTTEKHDAEIVKKAAIPELLLILEAAFDMSLPSTEPLPSVRERFSRHVLATDLICSLRGAVQSNLASVRIATKPAAREACVSLAHTWRLRRDARDSYVTAANKVEQELRLSQVEFSLDQIEGVETFLAMEKALLRQVEAALLAEPTEALLDLSQAGKSRFWSEALPTVQAQWALIAAAAQVLLEADRVEQALKKPPATLAGMLKAYTDTDQPWCLLDTFHRHMEKRWYDFEPEGDQHRTLEQLVRKAEQRYTAVGSVLAGLFVKGYSQAKLPLKGVMRQTDIFDTQVKPHLGKEKTAYVWVDALRYEMAWELCQVLAADFDRRLQPALATVPTITEVGMASLLPHNGHVPKVVSVGGGKLALEIDGTVVKDRKDRVAFLKAHAGVKVFDAKLDDLLPKPLKKVRDGIKDADLVLLTSQEIDELGEQDNVPQARRQMDGVLNDLRRGCRILADLGVRTIILVADHGHLFGEELGEDMKIDAPGGDTADLHRRVWVGKGGTVEPSYLRCPLSALGVHSDLDLATPWNFACFKVKGGARAYFHGGLSPQELIVPVLTLIAKALAPTAGTPTVSWGLLPGSKRISTRFFSVQIIGSSAGLFGFEPPKVRVEIRAKGKPISMPVSASYGFEEATGDVELKVKDDNSREMAPNTVTLMLTEEPNQKTVSVVLLDATTGAELAAIKEIEVVPTSF